MEVYAAQIDRMDRNVGTILDALRRTGQEQDTLILFAGRQRRLRRRPARRAAQQQQPQTGARRTARCARATTPSIMPGGEDTFASYGIAWANASNTPFRRYKHWVHEGGIASPLIARWPGGIDAARRHHARERAHHRRDGDLRGCGRRALPREHNGERVLPMEGRSLAPAFHAENGRAQRRVLLGTRGESGHGGRALQTGFALPRSLGVVRPGSRSLRDARPLRLRFAASASVWSGRYDHWAARCNVRPWDEVRKITAVDAGG